MKIAIFGAINIYGGKPRTDVHKNKSVAFYIHDFWGRSIIKSLLIFVNINGITVCSVKRNGTNLEISSIRAPHIYSYFRHYPQRMYLLENL